MQQTQEDPQYWKHKANQNKEAIQQRWQDPQYQKDEANWNKEAMQQRQQNHQYHTNGVKQKIKKLSNKKILNTIPMKQSKIMKLCNKEDKIQQYQIDEGKWNKEAKQQRQQDLQYHTDEAKQNKEAKQKNDKIFITIQVKQSK